MEGNTSVFLLKGCENFVCIDGLWKLRHPHCLYPVKAEVSGFPTVNYPNVCTEEPESQSSAGFCSEHSELARTKNIPTNLRAFIHDYCQVPKNQDGEINNNNNNNDNNNNNNNNNNNYFVSSASTRRFFAYY